MGKDSNLDLSGFDDAIADDELDLSVFDSIDPEDTSILETIGRGSTQGATLGLADEIGAAALTPVEILRAKIAKLIPGTPEQIDADLASKGFKGVEDKGIVDTYKQLRDVTREENTKASEDNPGTYLASDIVGGVIPGLLSGGGAAAANVLKTGGLKALGESAKLGAKYGAVSGLGYGESDNIGGDILNTALGAGIGGVAGAALPVLLKGAKEGIGKVSSGAKNLLETIVPESASIKAGYGYGKQGKKVVQDVIDNDIKIIAKKILNNIESDKKANNLKDVKAKLEALGYKVNTKKTIKKAIEDLKKLTKEDVLDLQNKDLLPKLRRLAGEGVQEEQLIDKAQKTALKKQIESQAAVDQAVIKGEKSLAKEAIKSGDSLETIADVNANMSQLDIPLQTEGGVVAGTRGKFKSPDGEEYVKSVLSDATPYQPKLSSTVDSLGRPIIQTVDKGTGRVTALVGTIEDKVALDLEKMTVAEVESLRKQLNLATKLAKAQGASGDPIMQRAQKLAGDLKEITDEVIKKGGDLDLINKRARFSDIFSAEELLGIDKRLAVRGDINKELMTNKIGAKLGFEQGFSSRQESQLAKDLLGKKVVTPEMRQQLDLLKKLNRISGRESQENISRAGLYKMAVADIPNAIGRGVRRVENVVNKFTTPTKNVVDILNTMTSEQVGSIGNKLSLSPSKGAQLLGQRLQEATTLDGQAKVQAIWSLSQSPAFRELIKRMVPDMEEEMMSAVDSIIPSAEASDTPYNQNNNMILDEIADSEGTSEAQARKKGYDSGYDVTLAYGKFDPPSDKPISEMTLSELKEFQRGMLNSPLNNLNSSAVGRYQIIKRTLKGLQNDLKLSDDVIFNKETQDKMAEELLRQRGINRYKAGSLSLEDFQHKLSREWASISDPEKQGKSYYKKQKSKKKDWGSILKSSKIDINSIIKGYADQTPDDLKKPSTDIEDAIDGAYRSISSTGSTSSQDIEDVNNAIDRVNRIQGSGDVTPVDQIDSLMGKIDNLDISEEDKNLIEDEAVNMTGFSDGVRLKELLKKIANLRQES